jgi:cyclic pyranopterin phosphate synthase
MLVDGLKRNISHIRISITDRCQLRCRYCLPEEGVAHLEHADILRYEEILEFMKVAVAEGIVSARLTGGEPLLRKGVLDFVRAMAQIKDLEDLSLTTNGLLLTELAQPLRSAGLRRINIGLSSMDPDVYRDLTRGGDLNQALAGLDAALRAGLDPVKLNVVVLRNISDDPAPYLELTRKRPVEVRFIEYMDLGPMHSDQYHVPMNTLKERLARLGPFEEIPRTYGQGPALGHLRLPGAPGSFALIPAASGEFCSRCNRLRLTSDGHLRMCLFAGQELDLKPALRPTADPERLRVILRQAIAQKPKSMAEAAAIHGRRMSQIGG